MQFKKTLFQINLSSLTVETIAGTGKQGTDLEGGNSWINQVFPLFY